MENKNAQKLYKLNVYTLAAHVMKGNGSIVWYNMMAEEEAKNFNSSIYTSNRTQLLFLCT